MGYLSAILRILVLVDVFLYSAGMESLCGFPLGVCFLPQSKVMQVRWTGDSKLPIGVKLSVFVCLSVFVQ